MTQNTIPVVDLHDYLSGDKQRQEQFVKSIGDALCQVGFFALLHHGVDDKLISDSYHEIATFYKLPLETKKKYEGIGLKGQRGFTSFGREHAKNSQAPDLKEFWHVGREFSPSSPLAQTYPPNIWPAEVPPFKNTMLNLYNALEKCALTVLEACALYLNEEKNLFRNIAVDGNSILRLIHYPPIAADADPRSIRAQAHEDINLITLLIEATTSGLEILDRRDNWIPVVTPPNCIIIDAGDMLQNITNGFYKSTTHRVVNPADNRETRYSMPFFVHARAEVDLSPLASCVEKTGGKKNYPNITANEYLLQRLREIGLA